jgi:hypothetical protein
MKKKVLVLASLFAATTTFAQDLTSRKGETILPEAGDWAIGIDAAPFLNFAGQMFSNAGASAPGWNFLNSSTMIIRGKMFVDEKTAYRASLRIGFGSTTMRGMVATPTATAPTYPTLPAMTEDEWKSSYSFIGIGGGLEMRRGNGRLQGFYGGEALIWSMGSKDAFTYSNALAPTATVPVTVANSFDFSSMGYSNITTEGFGNVGRVLEDKAGSTFGIAIMGFVGAEYFIMPKISIAGEFNWGIGFESTGNGTMSIESIDGTTPGVVNSESSGSSMFVIDVNRNALNTASATLTLNLHF